MGVCNKCRAYGCPSAISCDECYRETIERLNNDNEKLKKYNFKLREFLMNFSSGISYSEPGISKLVNDFLESVGEPPSCVFEL
jgi:hypothetical protein